MVAFLLTVAVGLEQSSQLPWDPCICKMEFPIAPLSLGWGLDEKVLGKQKVLCSLPHVLLFYFLSPSPGFPDPTASASQTQLLPSMEAPRCSLKGPDGSLLGSWICLPRLGGLEETTRCCCTCISMRSLARKDAYVTGKGWLGWRRALILAGLASEQLKIRFEK